MRISTMLQKIKQRQTLGCQRRSIALQNEVLLIGLVLMSFVAQCSPMCCPIPAIAG
jgi:ABC-type amino acid transport system permease subunit